MKTLTLKDGTAVNLTDSSTMLTAYAVLTSFAELDSIPLTAENVEGGKFDDEPMNVKFESFSATLSGENVLVTIKCRSKTELEQIEETLADHEALINAMMGV